MASTRIVARRYDLSPEMKSYIEEKVEKLNKYYPEGILDIEVMLTKEKLQTTVDIKVDASGFTIKSGESAGDLRSAFDTALKKVELQLKKQKDRRWGNKKHNKSIRKESPLMSEKVEETPLPIVQKVKAQKMDLPEAIEMAAEINNPLVIKGIKNNNLKVLYKNEAGEVVVLEVE